MPGGQERTLRRRIRSVESTKKITRAMELISASRIVKAQQKVNAARPYAEQITEVIGNLAAAGAGSGQPLLTPRENVSNVGVIVLSADRGLAGGEHDAGGGRCGRAGFLGLIRQQAHQRPRADRGLFGLGEVHRLGAATLGVDGGAGVVAEAEALGGEQGAETEQQPDRHAHCDERDQPLEDRVLPARGHRPIVRDDQ